MNKAITNISKNIGTLISSFVGGPGHDDEEKRRRILFALMMLVSILIMFSYGFHHLNKGNSTQGLLLLIVGLIQTISLVSLRHLQNPLIIYRINVVIFGCWLLFIMIIGLGGGAGILWMFLFPPITFILLGKKEGLLLSIITFILSLFFLIDPHSTIGTYPYETGIKTRFPVIYGLLVLMGYIVRSVLKRYEEGMENEHLKLQSEIKVRIEAEEELKKYHDHLEELVQRRTSELSVANERLMNEVEERKQAEEALKESEEKYRSILENIAEGYYEVDLAGNFTFFNDSVCRMMGYPREELMGMNNRQYMDQENTKKLYQTFNKVYKTGKPTEEFGWEIIRKDRAKRFVGASVSLIKDSRGQPTGFRGIARDITERKQAENMLRESETRFRDLVESSLTGIYIIQDGQIVYKNSEQDRIFGDLSEPLSFNHFKNVYPEEVEKVKEFYENIFSGKIRSFDIDMRFFPTGEMDNAADMRWVHSRASVIKYQGKEAILVNMTDITRTRELEHLVRIDDKMTSLGRVAVGITHELRNPLSGINVYLTTLKKIYDSPESLELENLEKVEKILGKLQSASNKIESVIKRVMDFSKPTVPRLTLTSINRPIEEAINLCQVTFQKSGVKIEKSLCEDLPPCYSDPPLIEQVLLNLITNAAQAMENQEGEKIIEITSAMESNRVVIRVADSGPGIPLMLRKKIFEPFFTTKKDSSGIGLSLCHRIIVDHGGSLDVFASKWGGSEFRIKIPVEKRTAQQ